MNISRFSTGTGIAFLFLVISCFVPAVASAMTKCLCNDGTIAWSSEDDGDNSDCDDACDGMGGGRVWQPGDPDGGAQDVQGGAVIVPPPRDERPIERRGR